METIKTILISFVVVSCAYCLFAAWYITFKISLPKKEGRHQLKQIRNAKTLNGLMRLICQLACMVSFGWMSMETLRFFIVDKFRVESVKASFVCLACYFAFWMISIAIAYFENFGGGKKSSNGKYISSYQEKLEEMVKRRNQISKK